MKLALTVLTALVAFATVNCHHLPEFGKGALYEDIQYFTDMLPIDEIAELVVQYSAEDAEFQNFLRYLDMNEFAKMIGELEQIPQTREFLDYLQNHGVNIYDVMNKLNKRLGLPPLQTKSLSARKITGGLKGFVEDVKALVDYDLFIHGYALKMRTSPAFRDFVAQLKSPGHQKFVDAVYKNARYLKFRSEMISKHIDIVLIEDIIFTVLGITFPVPRTDTLYGTETPLSKDIHQFMALINKDKLLEIFYQYLTDDQVQQALNYFYSAPFHALITKIEGMKEYQNLVLYLHNAGLDIFTCINQIHIMIGMKPYVPPAPLDDGVETLMHVSTYANLGGMKALMAALKAALPMNEIKALYKEKMATSPAFVNFIQHLRAPEFTKLVNTVYSTPIFLEMRSKALEVGLDISEAKEILKSVIGIDLPDIP